MPENRIHTPLLWFDFTTRTFIVRWQSATAGALWMWIAARAG